MLKVILLFGGIGILAGFLTVIAGAYISRKQDRREKK